VQYITELAQKGDQATPEEVELMDLVANLIENNERHRWPMKRETCSPRELLAFLMEENGLKQADLSDIGPQSNVSAILAGRAGPSEPTLAALHSRVSQDSSASLRPAPRRPWRP
jgi:antitoxin component HigA of HigAB toxin-antitoxin module